MTAISIDECDLLEFFGSAHVSRAFGDEWFDSDSVYKHEQADGLSVTCAIHPIHKDARLTLSLYGEAHFDWRATALADIRYDREQRCLTFTTQDQDVMTLKLTPRISVHLECVFRRA